MTSAHKSGKLLVNVPLLRVGNKIRENDFLMENFFFSEMTSVVSNALKVSFDVYLHIL